MDIVQDGLIITWGATNTGRQAQILDIRSSWRDLKTPSIFGAPLRGYKIPGGT